MANITITQGEAASIEADALVFATAAGTPGEAAQLLAGQRLPEAAAASIVDLFDVLGVTGKADNVVRIPAPAGVAAKVIIVSGIGTLKDDAPTAEQVRRAAGAATRNSAGLAHVAFAFPTCTPALAAAVAEGAALGTYTYTTYKTKERPAATELASNITIVADDNEATQTAVKTGIESAFAVNFARDLVNQPPSDLYPESFAKIASDAGKEDGIKVTVLDDKQLAKGGYGGLTAVGMGSARGPRLAKLEWSPKGATKHVAIVGKGVTFDTGGISLKPAPNMELMKSDMGGAAAALGAIRYAARVGLAVKVTAYLCLAENMPSANAQRPSDIITILGGKTVEVLNTDAEGRLVLADGIVSASAENPDLILDIATLTGAQGVALGEFMSGVMGADDARETVVEAAKTCGEDFWPMPLPVELLPKIDSPVADFANVGDRFGGMLTAGLFLQEFVGQVGGDKAEKDAPKIPWAHLDIASPAFNGGKPRGYTPKGGTGVGVRTLAAVLAHYAG